MAQHEPSHASARSVTSGDTGGARARRRTLSTQGRILAAGVSVALGGALIGFMAAGDQHADVSHTTPAASSANAAPSGSGTSATPYDGGSSDGSSGAAPTGNSGFPTQPQTRTGGS